MTALYLACQLGQVEMALLLANAGADPDIGACWEDGTVRSPLYVAAAGGLATVCQRLLERGASLKVGEDPRAIPGLQTRIQDMLEAHVRK